MYINYFYCSKYCGAPVIHMEDVDNAVKKHVHTILSNKNQKIIINSLRNYKDAENDRLKDFNYILKKKTQEKQKQYDTLMNNLSSSVLPAEIVSDIGKQMNKIKKEIENLKSTKSPKDYTVDHITKWLNDLKKILIIR